MDWLPRLVLPAVIVALTSPPHVRAQSATELTYTSDSAITAQELSSETRTKIVTLVNEQGAPSERKKAIEGLCAQRITSRSPSGALAKKAIVETKASVATELVFQKDSGASSTLIDRFTFLVELSPYRVFTQHRRPRFSSDAAGFSMPFSKEVARAARFEGVLGADIFALVPPLKECGIQSIALCSRRYEKGDRLVKAPYTLTGVRVLVAGKAEAILAPPVNTTGKVRVSLRGSRNVEIQSPPFREAVGTQTISATLAFQHQRERVEAPPAFLSIANYPFTAGFEARADLGSDTLPLKTSRKLVSIEVSPFHLTEKLDLLVGNSELSVEGGECHLLTQWIDETI
jgi:hypothetical protein